MRRNRILWITLLAILGLAPSLRAQDFALKTNLVSDAALSPNLGFEVGLAPRWSLDVSGQLNAWPVNGHKWKHWLVQPEARYWFCDAITGHFVAVHALGGQYNVMDFKFLGTDFGKLKDHRYQGWFAGAGIAYGYSWLINKHWNIEAELGIGWIYTRYDKFECACCGRKVERDRPHNYFGPTKAAINLVYVF